MASPWGFVLVLAGVLLAWTLVSRWAQGHGVTGPMVFLATGLVLSGFADVSLAPEDARTLAELTLVVVLFHDASTVRLAALRRDPWVAVRLLGIGFPLAIVLTAASTAWLLPAIGLAGAVLVAGAITPTDAGLGAATILDPKVPVRVRRALNVESGLNDGLATPIVLAALAVIVGEAEPGAPLPAVLDIGAIPVLVGIGVGGGVGVLGAVLLDASYGRGLSTTTTRGVVVLTLPLVAFAVAELTDANGFIAAFLAGIAFGRSSRCLEEEPGSGESLEVAADLLGFVMWVVAGGLVAALFLDGFRWQWLVLAIAALTVLRVVPVALALLGTGFAAPTVLFLGWFGPRGLASIVFGLLTLEELGADRALVTDVTGVVGLTVLLSVVLHGATAGPLAGRYGGWVARTHGPIESEPSVEPMPSRGRGLPDR